MMDSERAVVLIVHAEVNETKFYGLWIHSEICMIAVPLSGETLGYRMAFLINKIAEDLGAYLPVTAKHNPYGITTGGFLNCVREVLVDSNGGAEDYGRLFTFKEETDKADGSLKALWDKVTGVYRRKAKKDEFGG